MRLDLYKSSSFDRGRPAWVEALWLVVQAAFVRSWLPGSAHRAFLLRLFGAQIGSRVVLKPGLKVKFPWRLRLGDHTWVGEDVWIDNLAPVEIGSHCCISQGAYLCTGGHDWGKEAFDRITKPIHIQDGAWLAARSVVAAGVTVHEGAVLGLGSVARRDLEPWTVYQGVPARAVKRRRMTGAAEETARRKAAGARER